MFSLITEKMRNVKKELYKRENLMILHVLFEISSDVLHKIFVHFIQSRINDPNTFNKQQQKRKGGKRNYITVIQQWQVVECQGCILSRSCQ